MDRPVKKPVMRSPMPKKRSKTVPLSERVTLERVLGVTVKDDSALACDPNTGLIAYPAGCIIVIFNPRNNKQTHIFNQSKKTITALAFSADGKNLVSGECGHNPAVRVWDVEDRSQVAELQGHKFGVACVAFSPNLRYVVSIGEQHDMAVNVWNWKEGAKVCSGKISNKVTGLCFSEDGGMFVTVGNRNVKFWYLSAKRKTRETMPLNGRSGILGEQRNNFFCSVACGKGANSSKTYCITKSGLLCEFNDSRLLDKWVELRTMSAYCLAASENHLYVGCADGVLRVFDAFTLHFVTTFPKPHFLGVNVSDGIDPSHMVAHQDNAKYPDTTAMVYDDVNKKVTCIYNDHSIYVWDVHDVKKIGKHWSFLYHSSCIWGVEVYPKMVDGHKEMLPPGSFITCSSDDTIRIWNTDPAMTSDVFKRNIYSKELLKILYVDEKFENLCDVDYNPAGTSDKTDPGEGKNGVRCLCVSPDGQYLASGDRSGNVRVHDLQFMDELYCIEAHDSEVLCLEFTKPETGYNLLASASRDRLIHVFNMEDQCSLLQTLDDHSSSITAVKFTNNNAQLQMISCGADKALMFRTAVQNPDFQFLRNHHVVGKQTLYDIAIDPTKKFVATACQDRNLRIHNTATGKLKRIYKGSLSDDGTLIKVELDPSGMYVATSCSDKTLAIFDFYSGECVATMTGHSELVTGIKFSNDCKHLISVSGDGCIFVWQLPWGLTHNMKERLAEMGQAKRREEQEYNMLRRGTYVVPPEMPLRIRTQIQAANHNTRNNNNNTEEQEGMDDVDFTSATEQLQMHALESPNKRESIPEDYRFSMGQLPLWAKKQVSGEDIPSPSTYSSPSQPKGRWAQRIDSKGIKVKSEWENTIEVRLEDCLDRRRYTVEPDALLEQVRILSHLPDFPVSEEELQQSVDDEFVSAEEGLKTFEQQLTDEEMERLAQSFVTSTRGSDPFLPPTSLSGANVDSPIAEDDNPDASQDEEDTSGETNSVKDEEEVKEADIIYPPSDETPSSPENLKFEITASTKSFEEHARRKRSREESKEISAAEKKVDDATKEKNQDSEATDPISVSTDDDEEMEDDSLEEEEEEEESSPSVSESKGDTSTPATSPDHDEEHFLHTNFSFMEKEKFGKCLEQLQSGFVDEVTTGRLSISSKFLSRSQLSQARGPVMGIHGLAATSGGISAEQYLLRRKQEMAMAVDKTRRRLQMLGWKVSDAGKKSSASGPEVSPRSQNKETVSSGSQNSSPSKVAVATSTVKEVDLKSPELDSADSLEDILDRALEQEAKKVVPVPDDKSPDTPTVESDFDSTTSPSRSSSASERKPPAVPPKPRRRRRSSKGSDGDESKQGTSSSSSDELSRSDELPGLKDEEQPREQPRKKELPQIPVLAMSQEASLVTVDKTMPEQEDGNADKENNIHNTFARRASGSGSKAKIIKIKNKKERQAVLRKASSMTDISAEQAPENSSGSPSMHSMTLRSHPRSHSSERPAIVRSVPNSPAREKRRAKNDRIVPLLPNQQQKLKSYEIGTHSSRAKVHARADTPPTSPHKLYKKKRSLLTELKENKIKHDDKKVESPVDIKSLDKNLKRNSPTEEIAANNGAVKEETVEVKADAHSVEIKSDSSSQASLDSLETEEKPSKAKSQKSEATTAKVNKQEVDRLAMPPPTAVRVGRSRTGRKPSGDSRLNERRKEPEGKEGQSTGNGAQKREQPKDSAAKASEKPPSKDDVQLRLSPDSDTSADVPAINGHDAAPNGHDNSVNGHVTPVNGHDAEVEGATSAGPCSPSSTCDSFPDDISAESTSEPLESAGMPDIRMGEEVRRKMTLDLSSPKEPTPSAEVVTPEELRAGVDEMKQAFNNCLSLFTKATSPDTPDISKGHQMLDYLSSTLNSMQNSVARLQSQRRRFYSCASEENLLTSSTTSLPALHDRSRATSVGFLPPMRSSSLTPSDLHSLKMSIAKTKAPGNGKSRDEETEAASALVLLDHYSEMLVSMVRDKIVEDINEGSLASTESSNPPYSSDV